MEDHNNAEFIYQYTSRALENVYKSIDVVTDKLTKVLAFSGVLLKFGYDMNPEGYLFSAKFLVLGFLVGAIGLCASGLWPKSSGDIELKPEHLLEEEQYGLTEEAMYVFISRERIKGIPKAKEIRDYRVQMLNHAIGCLVASGIVFGVTGMLSGIH